MTAATTLQTEVDAIMADVVGVDGAAITGLTFALGRREKTAHASPPRAVWVPVAASGLPPQKHAFPAGARSVLTRLLVLEVTCWGESVDAVDALVAGVLAAVHRRWSGRWSYQGETWDAEPAQTDLGESVTITLAVQLAVLDRPKTTATVTTTTFDTTAATSGDGTLHAGE